MGVYTTLRQGRKRSRWLSTSTTRVPHVGKDEVLQVARGDQVQRHANAASQRVVGYSSVTGELRPEPEDHYLLRDRHSLAPCAGGGCSGVREDGEVVCEREGAEAGA